MHQNVLDRLKQEKYASLFKTIIPENNKIAEAAHFDFPIINTLKQKWGYTGNFDLYLQLSKELIKKAEDITV